MPIYGVVTTLVQNPHIVSTIAVYIMIYAHKSGTPFYKGFSIIINHIFTDRDRYTVTYIVTDHDRHIVTDRDGHIVTHIVTYRDRHTVTYIAGHDQESELYQMSTINHRLE